MWFSLTLGSQQISFYRSKHLYIGSNNWENVREIWAKSVKRNRHHQEIQILIENNIVFMNFSFIIY